MSFYFRDKPRFSETLRGKSGDELLQEIKQQFDEDSKSFFEPTAARSSRERDPFERHSGFPRGFPFDDDGFGRRSDIRTHLDDLAARHPEFADQLLGPPWGDIPFHGSLRNRRRGSGSGSNNYQGHPDEDARSQASGGSAASAASGASGVSSHGEPETNHRQQDPGRDSRRNPLPNYGLRNTVDIGQHHHNMENPEKANRGQRSMSAPPENRQQPDQPQQGQRFVSRVDITPQYNQPPQQPQQQAQQQPQQQPQQPPQQSQQQQKAQQQGNVRHIPIFVEGRDEPVLPKNVDDASFRREPPPSQYHSTPHFPRSSPFGQSFGSRQHNWPPHFQETFYEPEPAFEQPMRRQQTSQGYHQQPKQQYAERPRPESQQQYYEQPKQQQQKPQQQQQQQEPPKPKPTLPKDPLERVAMVQKEVDSLAEQVKLYTGNSRKDKQYMFLDEMLTRELIKLDDIETEGRENVRQARKNAIKTIQQTISLLESKAPLPYSQQQSVDESAQQNEELNNNSEKSEQQAMEVDQKEEELTKEPIPLPPGPSSPIKTIEASQEGATPQSEEMKVDAQAVQQETTETTQTGEIQQPGDAQTTGEPMDITPADKTEAATAEVQQTTDNVTSSEETPAESKKEETPKKEETTCAKNKAKTVTESQAPTQAAQKAEEGQEKMEVDPPAKSPKKARKTKKQTPVSEQPIPLPAPEASEASAK